MTTRFILGTTLAIAVSWPGVTQATSIEPIPASASRTITMSGTATPGAALAISIDGHSYIPPAVRQTAGEAGDGSADTAGRYQITLDLNGDRVVTELGAQTIYRGISIGKHTLMVREYGTADHEPAYAEGSFTLLAPPTMEKPAFPSAMSEPTASPTLSPIGDNRTMIQSATAVTTAALLGSAVGAIALCGWLLRRRSRTG